VQDNLLFLILNASVVWVVIAGLLTWLIRIKALVLVILIAPFVILPAFQNVAGLQKLVSYYGTSLIYGIPGIVIGIFYAEYHRVKAYLKKASKLAFVARGGIVLSSLYLLSYFGQKIIFNNPLIQTVLRFVDGSDEVANIISLVDQDGAITAGACIAGCLGILGIDKYRKFKKLSQSTATEKSLESS